MTEWICQLIDTYRGAPFWYLPILQLICSCTKRRTKIGRRRQFPWQTTSGHCYQEIPCSQIDGLCSRPAIHHSICLHLARFNAQVFICPLFFKEKCLFKGIIHEKKLSVASMQFSIHHTICVHLLRFQLGVIFNYLSSFFVMNAFFKEYFPHY